MESSLIYYVFETAVADGQQASAVTIKNKREDALMLFHQIRASAYANQSVSYSLTMILDTWGNEVIRESWVRPEEE